jgi:hypothetical protein
MSRIRFWSCLLFFLVVAKGAQGAESQAAVDLRRAVPQDAYLALYHRHNPERDFQHAYLQEIYDTVQETRIIPRFLDILTSRIEEEHLEEAKSVIEQLRAALEPIDLYAILNSKEIVYAQTMQIPTSQHLVLLRTTPEAAASCCEAVENLFRLVTRRAQGNVTVQITTEGSIEVVTLRLPPKAPFRPTIAHVDDVVLFSTSEEMARQSLAMLAGRGGQSKFDDPRLVEALRRLPEPEDSVAFFDGKLLFTQLRAMGQFVRTHHGSDPKAERIAGLIETLFDQVGIIDYEVTVEYTEANRNCSATLGKLLPDAEGKWLAKALASGQPFENWHQWVPADATAYSLSTGVNLHTLYEAIEGIVRDRIPELAEGLEHFEQLQKKLDVHLDRDILQAFSGESVSVSFPPAQPSLLGGQDTVVAMRCHKPERIRELLHRLVDHVQQHPVAKTQQLELAECQELEGFEELSATILATFGAQPVIGFRDGWLIIGSGASAVKKVLDTRAGGGATIAQADGFKQFHLDIHGPVHAISYTDLAQSTRQVALMLRQVGAFVPAVVGMVGAQQDSEEMKVVQQLLGLLPSVGTIVSKFDFFQAKLSVTQAADEPATYLRRSVVLIGPPGDTQPSSDAASPP